MTREKARKLLGLEENFTLEDLKKAYFNKLKDANLKKLDCMGIIELETLREGLKKAYNCLKSSIENNFNNLEEYKKCCLEKMEITGKHDIQDTNYVLSIPKYVHDIINGNFRNFVIYLKKRLSCTTDITDAKGIFGQFEEFVFKNFVELTVEFYHKNCIPSSFSYELDYNCSIQEFYEQLLELNKSFLNSVLGKYETYSGFDELKTDIEAKIRDYVKNSRINRKKVDYDSEFLKIIENILNEYNEIINRFSTIQQTLDREKTNIYLNSISKEYATLFNEYKVTKDPSIKEKVGELEERLNYIIQSSKSKELRNLYQYIISIYYSKLQNLENILNKEYMDNLNKLLNQVLLFMEKIFDGYISLEDAINVLKQISFNYIDYEINLLNGTKSNIYLMKNGKSESFFMLFEDNGSMKMYEEDHILPKNVSLKEIEENYISLEDFLNGAIYVGEYEKINYIDYSVLYSNNGIFICADSNRGVHIKTNCGKLNYKTSYLSDKPNLIKNIKSQLQAKFRQQIGVDPSYKIDEIIKKKIEKINEERYKNTTPLSKEKLFDLVSKNSLLWSMKYGPILIQSSYLDGPLRLFSREYNKEFESSVNELLTDVREVKTFTVEEKNAYLGRIAETNLELYANEKPLTMEEIQEAYISGQIVWDINFGPVYIKNPKDSVFGIDIGLRDALDYELQAKCTNIKNLRKYKGPLKEQNHVKK